MESPDAPAMPDFAHDEATRDGECQHRSSDAVRSHPGLLSVVIPVHDEESVLPLLLAALGAVLSRLPRPAEILFVNDGSRDGTAVALARAAATDDRVKIVELSRSFGQQRAIAAGLDFARGDAVIVMDADLQDPPWLIPTLIAKYCEGYDVVYAQRTQRHGETWLRRFAVSVFYWLMRTAIQAELPDNAGAFRLMGRPVADALRQMREQQRFMPGLITWLGFRQTGVSFERPARAAGRSKHALWRRFASAWRAIASFSGLPLRLSLVIGGLLILMAIAGAAIIAYRVFVLADVFPAWALLACLQAGLSGVTLFGIGVVGDYIARMYEELKQRPLYVVRSLVNFPPPGILSADGRSVPGMLDSPQDAALRGP